jgi:8-oxo-dGTP pyrophosphatase MutT (NUDIX family)
MPTPEFIETLRQRIGHDLLWLSGVSGVVVNDAGEVLLTRRADSGRWAVVSGIIDPGEQPAVALAREIAEETGIEARVERLVSVTSQRPKAYPNGDEVQFLDLTFACRHVFGTARVADDENLEVGWFSLSDLPDISADDRMRLVRARGEDQATYFER